jgi:hypothetical protein
MFCAELNTPGSNTEKMTNASKTIGQMRLSSSHSMIWLLRSGELPTFGNMDAPIIVLRPDGSALKLAFLGSRRPAAYSGW